MNICILYEYEYICCTRIYIAEKDIVDIAEFVEERLLQFVQLVERDCCLADLYNNAYLVETDIVR